MSDRGSGFVRFIGVRCLAVMGMVLGGCAAADMRGPGLDVIPEMLAAQARAWNDGDIERFMASYRHAPDLTFSAAGKVTRGWQATLDNYRRRYPTREAMGYLTFSDLQITPLGDRAALVLGRWHVQRKKAIGGVFTLVLQKEKGRWVIVHDHTSRGGS